jgi:drug/metabolite transporter (DMT)-like permease
VEDGWPNSAGQRCPKPPPKPFVVKKLTPPLDWFWLCTAGGIGTGAKGQLFCIAIVRSLQRLSTRYFNPLLNMSPIMIMPP